MQIWADENPDGSEQEQITSDDYCNWFAHPSPERPVDCFSFLRKRCDRPSPNKDVQLPAQCRWPTEDSSAHEIVWRAGNNQCSILVAGQPECGFRQLSIGLSVRFQPVLKANKNVTSDDRRPLHGLSRAQPDGTLLSVKLQPRASINEIGEPLGD